MSWCHHPPRSPIVPHTEKCSLMTAGQVDLIWAISAGRKNSLWQILWEKKDFNGSLVS